MQTPVMYPALFQFIFLFLFLVPSIFFLLTLQNTMKVISPENRRMPPSHVWFLFIPLFNIVWQFIMVRRIAKSLAAECVILNIPTSNAEPTYSAGLTWNICNCLIFIPLLGPLASLVTWILYWVKVNEFKKIISTQTNNYMLDAEQNIFYGDHPKT